MKTELNLKILLSSYHCAQAPLNVNMHCTQWEGHSISQTLSLSLEHEWRFLIGYGAKYFNNINKIEGHPSRMDDFHKYFMHYYRLVSNLVIMHYNKRTLKHKNKNVNHGGASRRQDHFNSLPTRFKWRLINAVISNQVTKEAHLKKKKNHPCENIGQRNQGLPNSRNQWSPKSKSHEWLPTLKL